MRKGLPWSLPWPKWGEVTVREFPEGTQLVRGAVLFGFSTSRVLNRDGGN